MLKVFNNEKDIPVTWTRVDPYETTYKGKKYKVLAERKEYYSLQTRICGVLLTVAIAVTVIWTMCHTPPLYQGPAQAGSVLGLWYLWKPVKVLIFNEPKRIIFGVIRVVP